jgi:tripartite-type tricarboxylate transporter receptor subunit TctC
MIPDQIPVATTSSCEKTNQSMPMQLKKAFSIFFMLIATTVAGANPITINVGYAPGGLADRLSRLAASELSKELQRPVTVRNVTGASGLRAAMETVQSGEKEAHLLFADSSLLIAHEIAQQPHVDPWKFLPVGSFGVTPFALVVPASLPVLSIQDLIRHLNNHPAQASFGSPGMYSVHQLGVTVLLKQAKTSALHIPYQGGVHMLSDLLAGRLTFGILSVHLAHQYLQSGQLRVLGVTGGKRIDLWPNTPTISESFPGVQTVSSAYLLAAPDIQPEMHQQIVRGWSRMIRQRHVIEQLESLGMEGPALDSNAVTSKMNDEQSVFKTVLRQLK